MDKLPPPPPYHGATFETKDGLSFTRAKGGGVVVHLPGASEQAELGEAFVVLDAGIWSRVVALMKPEYAPSEDDHPALAAGRETITDDDGQEPRIQMDD